MTYQMTCGHNSEHKTKCPYKCPGSKMLIDLSVKEKEESIDRVSQILQQIDSLDEEEKVIILEKLFTEIDQGELQN